jgi:hypothetical protein
VATNCGAKMQARWQLTDVNATLSNTETHSRSELTNTCFQTAVPIGCQSFAAGVCICSHMPIVLHSPTPSVAGRSCLAC